MTASVVSTKELAPFSRLANGLEEARTLADVFWVVGQEAIGVMGLEDCVIYLVDRGRGVCVQAAAYGPKNPAPHLIKDPLEIPIGRGIVGRVAGSGQPALIPDVRLDPDYIVDDVARASELAVPISVEGDIIGVIDSEHSVPGFFTRRHLEVFTAIARLAAPRIEGIRLLERVRERTAEASRLKEFYEQLVDQLPIALAVLTPNGLFEYLNSTAIRDPEQRQRMLGRSLGELGPTYHEDEQVAAARRHYLAEALAGGRRVEFDERLTLTSGQRQFVHHTLVPMRDASGAITQVMAAAVDTTRQREAEDQLRQSQKMEVAGRLAGGVSHDFNNLLTVVRGIADLLQEEVGHVGQAAGLLDELQMTVRRGTDLTRQLLAFSRPGDAAPQSFPLDEAVTATSRLVKRLLPERIHLAITCGAPAAYVRMDPGALDQILLNLAANARDAMPGEGRLTITSSVETRVAPEGTPSAGTPASFVHLAITDTGHGMTEEVRARVFEPFFTTKPIGMGTGLGMATVQSIAQHAGGWITVESTLGVGTTMHLWLPAMAAPVVAPVVAAPAAALPVAATARILLVEDEDGVRRVVHRLLQRAGYTVQEARFGSEALALAADPTFEFDLLLSDVYMPGMNGVQLAAQLRAQRRGLRVLFMSGHVDDPAVLEEIRANGDVIVDKPFTADALLRQVQATLAPRPA